MRFLELKDTTTACPYLPDRRFTAENFLAPSLGPRELDRLLAAGFRHFGSYYFRPVCEKCQRCVPIRAAASGFRPSRSLKRVEKENRDLLVTVGPPSPSERSYSLYRRHQLRFEHRSSSTYEQYVRSFFSPTYGNTQLSVFLDDTLVSVLHLDVTSVSLSAVYCYYDTDFVSRSLGTFSILRALRYAREWRVEKCYLGYVVDGNRHMMYKSRYRPNQVLLGDGWVDFRNENGEYVDDGRYQQGFPGKAFRTQHPFSRILLDIDDSVRLA
jgi:arginine-tRNA-protein transferase